jgi:hypothetical protein
MGMWHLLGHKPDIEEEPVRARIERGISTWNSPYPYDVQQRVRIKGKKAQHVIDFVGFPATGVPREPIGIKILRPGDDSIAKAREYGFMVYDTQNTFFERWLRLAIMTKADRWSRSARELVASLSTAVVEVDTGDEDSIARRVPATLEQMAA